MFPAPPYFEGRFSNGPTYIERLASILNMPLVDYSAAGSTSGFTPCQVGRLLKIMYECGK